VITSELRRRPICFFEKIKVGIFVSEAADSAKWVMLKKLLLMTFPDGSR
jgi:hypothetical protein